LRVPAYRQLWLAGTFAFMSTQMGFLLRGILAWDLTEREGALGFVYLCFGLAMLVATPLGGVAADRLPNRRVLMVSQFVLFAAALLMGIAVVTDVVSYWMLPVASMAQGAAFGFYGPARVAFAADLVGPDQLGNAVTLSMLSMNGTRVIAPSFAGALAGWALFGIGGAYLVSAGFGAAAMFFLLRCPAGAARVTGDGPNPFVQIADGVRYVFAHPPLRRLLVSSFFVIMFGFNYVAFVPAIVKDLFDLDDGYVGILMSASAIGAVAVAVAVASRADGPQAKRIMVFSGLVFGGGVIALALSPVYGVAVVVVAILGGGTTGYQSLSNTLALDLADADHRGRVQSLLMLSFAGFGIAAGPLGVLAEAVGLRAAVALMGSVAAVSVVAYAFAERAAARRPVPANGPGPDAEVGRAQPPSAGPVVAPITPRR
jgi:MFS family permease